MTISLPDAVLDLVSARNRLRDHYAPYDLRFTFDGNLVGDFGEAVAAEAFGIVLARRGSAGIDGQCPIGRSVQIKASVSKRGAAFRSVEALASHLIFLHLDLDKLSADVIFNGPIAEALRSVPPTWQGQRIVPLGELRRADQLVHDSDRIPLVVKKI